MPTVAIIEGVKIQFYPKEHPPPHFHAVFAEYRAQIDIASLTVLKGSLPPAKLHLIVDWAKPRRDLLTDTWDAVLARRKFEKIV